MAMSDATLIIVSDDDEPTMVLYKFILEGRIGLDNVIYAPSSEHVLTICREQPVGLVISDVSKPEMDGFEMLRQLRADPAVSRVPLLFVTTRADALSRRMALDLGADGYLVKPFGQGEFIAVVKSLLDSAG